MNHLRFDTDTGPLWRVQIVTSNTFEKASKSLSFGPEMEAIIEDDSEVDTRWRYYLRYMQASHHNVWNLISLMTYPHQGIEYCHQLYIFYQVVAVVILYLYDYACRGVSTRTLAVSRTVCHWRRRAGQWWSWPSTPPSPTHPGLST